MPYDKRVTTWQGKQVMFDNDLLTSLTEGESEYSFFCLLPDQVWVLLTLLEFYGEFHNRFVGFDTVLDIDNLRASTLRGLINPVACSEDLERIAVALEAMAVSLEAINLKIGPVESDLDQRLEDIDDALVAIEAKLPSSTLFDEIETVLDNTAVILGAPSEEPEPVP